MTTATSLKLRQVPDPCLRRKTVRIRKLRPELRELARDMLRTMQDHQGVGLAANQVGLMEKITVIQSEFMPEPLVLINPEIVYREGERQVTEGCLSIPGREELVTRSTRIRVKATALNGRQIKISAEDLLAQIIEHETDHLNGVLYTDHVWRAKNPPLTPTIIDLLR